MLAKSNFPLSPAVYILTRKKASGRGLTLIVNSQVPGEGILEGAGSPVRRGVPGVPLK